MSASTEIQWADSTFNPWIGCTKVGPGCDHCYAERDFDHRRHVVSWGAGQARKRTRPANWHLPVRWNAEPFYQCACGHRGTFADLANIPDHNGCVVEQRRRRVFCASLADVFDNEVDPDWRADLFRLIQQTPNLDWLLLTKRIGNAEGMVADALAKLCRISEPVPRWPWPNVWLGATVVNQAEADRDIPKLLATPAAVRFLSVEPMLGPVDLTDISDGHADSSIPREYWLEDFDTDDSPPAVGHNALDGERWQRFGDWHERGPKLDWVICGGESGPKARPMHPEWARSLRDQCTDAGVPFLFKQNGEWASVSEVAGAGPHHTFPDGATVRRVGKKAAGRHLDGRTHDQFPELRA